jgi:hypothetical protein
MGNLFVLSIASIVLFSFTGAYAQTPTPDADLNQDGSVDEGDLLLLLGQWHVGERYTPTPTETPTYTPANTLTITPIDTATDTPTNPPTDTATLAPSTTPTATYRPTLAPTVAAKTWVKNPCSRITHDEANWPEFWPDINRFALAYDANREQVVLFGGFDEPDGERLLDATLVYGRTGFGGNICDYTWTQRYPANSPSARTMAAMVYDPGRDKVVLYGGLTRWDPTLSYADDTWEWDGQDWRFVTGLSSNPGKRAAHAMAYDSSRRLVVLYGGFYLSGSTTVWYTDTWTYDGSTWRRENSQSPSDLGGRYGSRMVYHRSRQRVVLFGGMDVNENYRNDTWEYSPAGWTPVEAAQAPPSRCCHGFAYDDTNAQIVLFGGSRGSGDTAFFDTWEYDGTWREATEIAFPNPEEAAEIDTGMVFDSVRSRLIMTTGEFSWELPR